MSFIGVKITKGFPDAVVIGAKYTLTGKAKLGDIIGAPPWVYAELQHKEWIKPSIVESVSYVRGFPNPLTGEFNIDWTPEVEGIFEYSVIATPAPLPIGGVKAASELLLFPVMDRTALMQTTTGDEEVDTAAEKTSVEYAPSSLEVDLGGKITATVIVKNTGVIAHSFAFRLDLKNSEKLTVNEGEAVSSNSIAPGESGTVNLSSIAVPADWATGSTIVPRLVLIGHEGVWDTGPTFTIPSSEVTKESIVYTPASYEVALGDVITATVTLNNPSLIPVDVTLRLDLKNSNKLTVNEGSEVTKTIPAGGNAIITVNSIAVPSDWAAGSTITPRLVYIGKSGVWDTGPDFTISGTSGATLSVSPAIIDSGETVTFSFTGFKANATVSIKVGISEVVTAVADASGAGSASAAYVGSANTYTVIATDTSGNSATAYLTVTSSTILTVSPVRLKSGSILTYAYKNFTPNATISAEVLTQGGGVVAGPVTTQSDASGNGNGAFTITGIADVYFLYVSDAAGKNATAEFTLLENITEVTVKYSGLYNKVAVGYGLQCSATVTQNGAVQDVTHTIYTTWASSDESKATVSQLGAVSGKAVGSVIISVEYTAPVSGEVYTGSVNLQVVETLEETNEPTPASINITPTAPSNLTQWYNQQFDAFIKSAPDSNYVYHDNLKVHWKSTNTGVATISSYGIAMGVSVGTTQIYCVYGGVESNRVTLTVVAGSSGLVTVKGQVVDAFTQAGIPGTTVEIDGKQANTDSTGVFTMYNVSPGGPKTVKYTSPGYASRYSQFWIFQTGKVNSTGTFSLFAITSRLIKLSIANPSAWPSDSYWAIVMRDALGNTCTSVGQTPVSETLLMYFPDSWTFPATFFIYLHKPIGVNTVQTLAYFQSLRPDDDDYINAQFTDLGTYNFEFSGGTLTKTG